RPGSSEQEPLTELDSKLHQGGALRIGFRLLGDHRDRQPPGKAGHRRDQGPVAPALGYASDILAVDLDEIDGKCVQVVEGRRPGAEIVQADAKAVAAQALKEAGDFLLAVDDRRFS